MLGKRDLLTTHNTSKPKGQQEAEAWSDSSEDKEADRDAADADKG